MSDTEQDPDMRELARHAAQLGEHFDSVRIFATRTQDGKTFAVSTGSGNWHAQYGTVREWMLQQDERARDTARRREAQ